MRTYQIRTILLCAVIISIIVIIIIIIKMINSQEKSFTEDIINLTMI